MNPPQTDLLARIERVVLQVIELFIIVALAAILFWVFVLVVLRYGFGESIIGGIEVLRMLFVYSTALGAVVAIGRREHITINVLTERMPHALQNVADVVSLLLVAFFNVLVIWHSVPWISKTGFLLLPATGLPQAVQQIIMPVSGGLAIFFCLIRAYRTMTGAEVPRWRQE